VLTDDGAVLPFENEGTIAARLSVTPGAVGRCPARDPD
jgi:hypothetical protein